ncbi:energy transducer TonB [Silvibacterium sp.]|uniref:energy transducer TonB n=1 Tax=Silvibacterium sp. TaxID=1964179 RepID=UPI0039E2ACAB
MSEQDVTQLDAELEQMLRAALVREAAPPGLMADVELRLLEREAAQTAVATPGFETPSFQTLSTGVRSRWTTFWSAGAHAAAIALVVLVVLAEGRTVVKPAKLAMTRVEIQPFLTMTTHDSGKTGGGGGGGAHDAVEAMRGRLPKFSDEQKVPPQIVRNDAPKLPVEATVVMPPMQVPDSNLPNLGMPQSPQVALASQGPGSGSGFGVGSQGGVGSGSGPGVGPGANGGYGGGDVMGPGPGVIAPQLYHSVEPEFSDEARREKAQGICVVDVIVDANGMPTHITIEQPLGYGLEEKAIEAVEQYRWKPAMYHGHPVAVRVRVLVNFRIM